MREFILLLLFYHLGVASTGKFQVRGSSQTVLAKAGEDVILPCHIEPPVDASKMTVRWFRPDLNPQDVHVLSKGHEDLYTKNPLYKRRTSLFDEELPRGNISLKLFRVQLSDEGTYKCYVPSLNSSSEIQLLVGTVSQPVISLTEMKGSLLSWSCDSGCWYPQPEMSLLDSEGNILPAEPSVPVKQSQGCFTVQRKVTVMAEVRVTCRVHQPHINYTNTVETQPVNQAGDFSQPMICEIGRMGDYLSFSCDSGCWYPEPKVFWLDGEGNILPAGPSVTVRPSDHCYNVQTNVTVRRARRVICRVNQPPHLAEGRMDISVEPEDYMALLIIIAGVVLVVLNVVVFLGVFMYRKKKATPPPSISEVEKLKPVA